MNKLIFWGSSDDLVEVEGCTHALDLTDHGQDSDTHAMGRDNTAEYNVYNEATFQIANNPEALVKARYNEDGIWVFTVVFKQQGINYPNRIYHSGNNDYSMELEIMVPDNQATVTRVK